MDSNKAVPNHEPARGCEMYDTSRATYEAELARAHRALSKARDAADRMNCDGEWLDVTQILVEVTRLAEDSASGRRRKPPAAAANG